MTTTQKIKLLTTPTVRGEIVIRTRGGNKLKYPFADLIKQVKYLPGGMPLSCVMIGDREAYLQPRGTHLLIWNIGFGGNMEQRIPWKLIEISWAHYITAN